MLERITFVFAMHDTVLCRVCHKGHSVSYSRYSRFFCDCGAGAIRGVTCQALKQRSVSQNIASKPAQQHAQSKAVQRPKFLIELEKEEEAVVTPELFEVGSVAA